MERDTKCEISNTPLFVFCNFSSVSTLSDPEGIYQHIESNKTKIKTLTNLSRTGEGVGSVAR